MSGIDYLDAAATTHALPWPGLIDALDDIFTRQVTEPVRHHHTIKVPGDLDATLLLMPAWLEGKYLGVKQVTVFPGNRQRGEPGLNSIYLLSCAKTGKPLLQLDADTLTARRTAAASALASRYLSRADSSTLLIMGAGRLARSLIGAHCAARPIDKVYIWNRNQEGATKLAQEIKNEKLEAAVCSDEFLPECAAMADIISCATMSTKPILHGSWLQPGVHIDLVGAFRPDMRESDDEAVRKAAVFVDTRAGALEEAGDLIQPITAGVISEHDVIAELPELCSGQHHGRASLSDDAAKITLFKSVGAAREDLAGAMLAYANYRR